MGLYYNDRAKFREVIFDQEWTMSSASNLNHENYKNFHLN